MNEQNNHQEQDTFIQITSEEVFKMADWLKSDLLLQSHLVKIDVRQAGGIGQAVTVVAYDFEGKEIATLDATDYGSW